MKTSVYAGVHVGYEEPIITCDSSNVDTPCNIVTQIEGINIFWRDCDHAIAAAEQIKADALAIKARRAASEALAPGEKIEGTSQSEAPARTFDFQIGRFGKKAGDDNV